MRDVEQMYLPVSHAEGKLVFTAGDLPVARQVLFYAERNGNVTDSYPANPNGSLGSVAGVCDGSGQVFALMPHPERHIRYTQHPAWTKNKSGKSKGDGLIIFYNAVKWVEKL
jgi:phosphoribosylformylglycinamidine synthase